MAHEARSGVPFGMTARGVEVDSAGVMGWVREAQARIAPHDSPERFRSLGVDVIQGAARFITYPEAIKQAADDFQKSRFRGPVKELARWFERR
ncbi:MAG: hypothetical protein ACR2M1_12075 [Gemmatimonadaceae bacterium]